MDTFQQHEIFEIEVIDKLYRAKILEPLVFGGGTMLRLCHELPRYSVDLDFWLIKSIKEDEYFYKIKKLLEKDYEITDSQIKHYTIIFEIRCHMYPRRLKIEIRRETKNCDYQDKIAFSRFATRQVVLKAHTLEQTMENKIDAFLNRNEIRDCFDIEFMLRRGIDMPLLHADMLKKLKKRLHGLTDRDFKVKLGSILENDIRPYYISHGFEYLNEKLTVALDTPGSD